MNTDGMTKILVLFLTMFCVSCPDSSIATKYDDDLIEAKVAYVHPGTIEVQWDFKRLGDNKKNEDFTLSYGIIDRGKDRPKWMQLRHVSCCQATLSKLCGHARYGVKLAALVDNRTLSSPVQEVNVTQGVPDAPRDIAMVVDMETNQTLLTWKQDYAMHVLYYNVTLRMRDEVHQAQAVNSSCRFRFVPEENTSLEINVTAVNMCGPSEILTTHKIYTSSEVLDFKRLLPTTNIALVVIVVPVVVLGSLVTLVTALFYIKRRRAHSKADRGSADDNGSPYVPLHLRNIWLEETRSSTRDSFYDVEGDVTNYGQPPRTIAEGRSYGHRANTYRRLEEYDKNGQSRGRASPTVARQLVDGSPYLATRRTRPPSSISRASNTDKRSSKQTPIIPLPQEKLLARVGGDPGNNLSKLSASGGS